MYRTRQVRIKKGNRLRDYCREICTASGRLYNRANFLIRQYATACRDQEEGKALTENQLGVCRMVEEATRGWTTSVPWPITLVQSLSSSKEG